DAHAPALFHAPSAPAIGSRTTFDIVADVARAAPASSRCDSSPFSNGAQLLITLPTITYIFHLGQKGLLPLAPTAERRHSSAWSSLPAEDVARVWPHLVARHPGDALELDHKRGVDEGLAVRPVRDGVLGSSDCTGEETA